MLGVVSFLLLALCFAAVAAFAVAVIAAHARHVPTTAWFTATDSATCSGHSATSPWP